MLLQHSTLSPASCIQMPLLTHVKPTSRVQPKQLPTLLPSTMVPQTRGKKQQAEEGSKSAPACKMGNMNAGTSVVLKGKAGEETQGTMMTAKPRSRQGKAVDEGGKKKKAMKAKYAPPHLFFSHQFWFITLFLLPGKPWCNVFTRTWCLRQQGSWQSSPHLFFFVFCFLFFVLFHWLQVLLLELNTTSKTAEFLWHHLNDPMQPHQWSHHPLIMSCQPSRADTSKLHGDSNGGLYFPPPNPSRVCLDFFWLRLLPNLDVQSELSPRTVWASEQSPIRQGLIQSKDCTSPSFCCYYYFNSK